MRARKRAWAVMGVAAIVAAVVLLRSGKEEAETGGVAESLGLAPDCDTVCVRSTTTAASPEACASPRQAAPVSAPSDLSDESDLSDATAEPTDRYADCEVLDERVGELRPDGRCERVRIVRTEEKYPLLRVAEVVQGSRSPVLLSQIAMAADHVTLKVKPGTSPSRSQCCRFLSSAGGRTFGEPCSSRESGVRHAPRATRHAPLPDRDGG